MPLNGVGVKGLEGFIRLDRILHNGVGVKGLEGFVGS